MQKQNTVPTVSESRAFRLDDNILKHVLKSQAGTEDKALLELVMNSVDANASRVTIELSETKFSVRDDGKGFSSREEIENFFETFGTPHIEGDAVYGKFRMGRGQIMAFAKNRWRSGPFYMDVDIEHRGLNYELAMLDEPFQGCLIEGEFYTEMRPSQLLTICAELQRMVKYVAIPVYLNGECVSLNVAAQKWTLEDDDAFYLLNESSNMQVYNRGVFVRSYYENNLGQGGVIVSKRPLEVNFARNDILTSKCETWKRICAVVRKHTREKQEAKPRKTEGLRIRQVHDVISADVESSDEFLMLFKKAEIITDFRGKHWNLPDLLAAAQYRFHGKLVMAQDSADRVGDKLHSTGQALVLAPRTVARCNVQTFPDMLTRIERAAAEVLAEPACAKSLASVRLTLSQLRECFQDIKTVGKHIKDTHEVVDPKRLTAEESRVLKLLNKLQYMILWAASRNGQKLAARTILAGASDTALMWTDGAKTVFVDRKLLSISGYHGSIYGEVLKLANGLVHEYQHNDDDTDSHVHTAEFYEHYHNVTVFGAGNIGRFVQQFINEYVRARLKEKASVRRGERDALDLENDLVKLAA